MAPIPSLIILIPPRTLVHGDPPVSIPLLTISSGGRGAELAPRALRGAGLSAGGGLLLSDIEVDRSLTWQAVIDDDQETTATAALPPPPRGVGCFNTFDITLSASSLSPSVRALEREGKE